MTKALNIKDFLKEPIAAAHFLEDIEKAVLSLDIMPKRVALVEEEPWRSHGIHKLPVKRNCESFSVNCLL